jgi:hypothetical protein
MVTIPGDGTKEILSDSQAEKKVRDMYAKQDEGIGRAPTIYHTLRRDYVNISWAKVTRAIKSTKNYQLNDARQLSKPKGGATVDGDRVGGLLEADLAVFSKSDKGILSRTANGGHAGLLVIVDAMSGYVGVEPYKSRTGSEIAKLARRILTRFKGKMKLKGGTLISDSGVEFIGTGNEGARNVFTAAVNDYGLKYSAVKKGRTAVHVESKNGDIRRNIN